MDIEFSIWLASKTRWTHLQKTISMCVVPRVGDWVKFTNEEMGDYFAWQVSQVTYRESGSIEVWTGLLENIDGRGYSFESEPEFDEYFQSYIAEGWRCEHGIGPNRRCVSHGDVQRTDAQQIAGDEPPPSVSVLKPLGL